VSLAVHQHVEPFIVGRWNEVAGEEVEVLVTNHELVLFARVPSMQSGFADLAGDLEIVEPVCTFSLHEQRSHPRPLVRSSSREVEHDGHSGSQEIKEQASQGITQSRRIANVVGQRYFAHPDKDGRASDPPSSTQFVREGRFSGGDLAGEGPPLAL
jgi:hypothetical protein